MVTETLQIQTFYKTAFSLEMLAHCFFLSFYQRNSNITEPSTELLCSYHIYIKCSSYHHSGENSHFQCKEIHSSF